jgi:hypothetical protein
VLVPEDIPYLLPQNLKTAVGKISVLDEEYKRKCCNRISSGCLFQWINRKIRCLFPMVYIFDA